MARKYHFNEQYFDNIEKNQAYLLGLYFADGSNNTRYGISKIELIEDDIDILFKIKEDIKYTGPLLKIIPGNKNSKTRYRFVINSKIFSKKLETLGVISNKTFKIQFPKFIKDEYIKYFILGFFDGDGSVYTSNRSNFFAIYNNKKNFLEDIQCCFKKHGFNCSLIEDKRKNKYTKKFYRLVLGGNAQLKRLYNFLYDEGKYNFCFNRKKNKFEEIFLNIETNRKRLVPKKIKINQIDDYNNVIKEFESISKASRETGVCLQSIWHALKNPKGKAGGFKWTKIKTEYY